MELSILAVFLASYVLSVGSHPKNSDVIPKDFYKRQILQPIPGYIPVYIKADGVPIVRTGSKTHSPNVQPQKSIELKEQKAFKETKETISSQEKQTDEVKSETSVSDSKTPLPKIQEKVEPTLSEGKIKKPEKNSQDKLIDVKPHSK